VKSLSDLMRNFMQLGYVTEDLDAAVDFLESTLGTVQCVKHYRSSLGRPTTEPGVTDPLTGSPRLDGSHVVVDGSLAAEWVIDVALVNAGPTNIEIIRPVSGSVELYRSRLRPDVPATFHHLGFRIDDFDEVDALVQRSGRTWAQYGASGGMRFGYLDLSAELGHFVEVMELDEGSERMFSNLEAASDAVD
jgi:hypothetical protein